VEAWRFLVGQTGVGELQQANATALQHYFEGEYMPTSAIDLLLGQLDQGFDHRSWHGPNLRGSIRGVKATRAAWRPAEGRHCIWEIVVHAAYWKYIARRRLLGEKRGSFPLAGSDWFARPVTLSEKAWAEDIALLEQMHATLRQAVAGLDPADLEVTPAKSKVSNLDLIRGVAAHDLYHAGQIQLLKRLAEQAEG
jgi:hypothetical protein